MMRTALTLLFLLLLAPTAHAASVAYIADGEVWLSSLDGSQKVKLAEPVINGNGVAERWNAVAQADNGRIVATRNEPGKIASLSSFQVWEPNGAKTIQGPLNSRPGWSLYAYPVGFDLTADGAFMAYGYSNSGLCCPIPFQTGTYVRPVSNSVLQPFSISGEDPTIFGSRVVSHSGSTVSVQRAEASVFGDDFQPWFQNNGVLDIRRTDIAANGQLLAFEQEQWTNGGRTFGKVSLLKIRGVGQPLYDPAVLDCDIPATGVAIDASLSQDATRVAWSDGGGVKVAGVPTTVADPCVMSTPTVVIAPKGESASIGPADVAAFLPPVTPPPPPLPPGGSDTPKVPTDPGTATELSPSTAPTATVPARVTPAALSKGLAITVQATAPGKVTLTATVPAKALGRKGKAVVIATGSGTARAAGKLTVKLKLNATGRKQAKKLKGKKATLKITQGARSTTKTITLR